MFSRRQNTKERFVENAALERLASVRAVLLREQEASRAPRRGRDGEPEHLCCTRQYNQMRISPLEARAIVEAFRQDPDLRRKLPEVLARLRRELPLLDDNDERQSFDCPLLDGTRCLVHRLAKPVGCLAWQPRSPGEAAGEPEYTTKGWQSFAERDAINDRLFGPHWKLRVIPLWLKRVFSKELQERRAPATGRAGPPGFRKRRRRSKKNG